MSMQHWGESFGPPIKLQYTSDIVVFFAKAFAIETCLIDNNVEMVYFNQLEMRNHLCICLEKG